MSFGFTVKSPLFLQTVLSLGQSLGLSGKVSEHVVTYTRGNPSGSSNTMETFVVYYESLKRELKTKPKYEFRYDERRVENCLL